MPKTAGTATLPDQLPEEVLEKKHPHAMKIRFSSAGEIEINDDIHGLNIDAAS